jgi:predicted nucleic acid-binding protein
MRVVLDTNILVSALIAPTGNPAVIYNAWEQGKFTLLTCTEPLLLLFSPASRLTIRISTRSLTQANTRIGPEPTPANAVGFLSGI